MSKISLSDCSGGGGSPTLPPELRGLTGLRELAISGSQLVGLVPPEYSELTALEILQLTGNQLTGEAAHRGGGATRAACALLHSGYIRAYRWASDKL